MKSCIEVGDLVQITDNRRIVTHITPRWSYGCIGKIVRQNDLSVTVELNSYCPGERIRVNYEDVVILNEKEVK